MKTIKHLYLIFLLLNSFLFSNAQNIILKQSNESGIYKKGEPIRVTANLKENISDTILVRLRINFGDTTSVQKIKYNGEPVTIFNNSYNNPTSVIIYVTADNQTAKTGLVVDPEEITPVTKYPKDLKSYWKREKKELHKLPMDIKETPVSDTSKNFVCNDIEINCIGSSPVRGYFAKPQHAEDKSLPIVLLFHAAGVKGSWCLSKPENALRYAEMGKGALCFDLNAHGMLNGQPQAYYDSLEVGLLKDYKYKGLENRDSIYFRGMYLRLLRTLDYLTKQPEWDRKRILVIGESQGGGQALAIAGLDKRVTAVVATVPAMCDWGRSLIGEQGGWPDPFHTKYDKEKMLKTVPYFDVANLLKGSKATLVVEIGFVDETCPSKAIYAAINQSKGKKTIYGVTYREHKWPEVYYNLWEKTVHKAKNKFIEDYIK